MVLTTAQAFVADFYPYAMAHAEEWRIGQAYMNYCREFFPELYALLSGHVNNDCFYQDKKLQAAIAFTYENW